jgi:endonuclease-3
MEARVAAPVPTGARFDVGLALRRIEDAIRVYPKAALFELHEDGHRSLFEQLIACIISIRTRDEQTIQIARRLFARARTPAQVAAMDPEEIERLIYPTTFHHPKARQIRAIAERAVELGGALPCDPELLRSFAGVGPKCANLALGIACGATRIAVDVHVHRVTNRWGYVHERTPEATMVALEAKLPREHWIEINKLLVPFGKHVCTGVRPHCSTCPVLDMCQQVGITSSR